MPLRRLVNAKIEYHHRSQDEQLKNGSFNSHIFHFTAKTSGAHKRNSRQSDLGLFHLPTPTNFAQSEFMDLTTVLENLKNTKLWRRWLLTWLGIGIFIGLPYSLTRSLTYGLFAASYFHVTLIGIGVLIYHPKDSIVPFLSALSVSLLFWGLALITGLGAGVTLLEFVKAWSELFYSGLILGLAIPFLFGVLLLGKEVLNLAQKTYLKIENKLVGTPKK